MDPEHSGNGDEPLGKQLRPVTGLRLRPLPPCRDHAFPVLHDYFETVYGPMIGPTSLVLARSLARHVHTAGGPVTVCPIELSLELGLRASHNEPIGATATLTKAIKRLRDHRLVEHIDSATLGVVMNVPPLSARALGKLPESVQRAHSQFVR